MRSLSNDMSKWDHFHMDHKKNLGKRDIQADEKLLAKDQDQYTFKPNIPKQSLQPLIDKEQGPATMRRRPTLKPELDMGKKKKIGSVRSDYE